MLVCCFLFLGSCEADPSKVLEGSMKITEATFGDVDGAHVSLMGPSWYFQSAAKMSYFPEVFLSRFRDSCCRAASS